MSEIDDNPFRAPESDLGFQDINPLNLATSSPMRVVGKFLVVKSGVVLPRFCVKTNVPVPESNWRKKSFAWCPPLVYAAFILGPLIFILVYMVACKRCNLTFGLSDQMKWKYRNRLIVKILIALTTFIASPLTAGFSEAVSFAILVLFLIAFVAVFLGNSPLTITKHQKGEFWVSGCSKEFLARISDDGVSPFKAPQPFFEPQ